MEFAAYAEQDGLGLGELVRRGEVSAGELLETAIARAERVNPAINAIVHRFDAAARAAAAAFKPADEPFAGVPLLLKDVLGDCAGVPTRYGSRFIPPLPMPADCHFVARLKRAGFIPFAKTNVPEFGLPPITEPRLYGPARNPWDLGRTPGGSSGGSAAAVAAGIVPLAHANDSGGSIRIPAACCGLVGLKPSRGRSSLGPRLGDVTNGLLVEHVVSRSVRDSAAALDAVAGYEVGDPYTAPPPSQAFLAALAETPRRLRIGFSTRAPYGGALDGALVAATEATAGLCRDLGHRIEEADLALNLLQLGPAFLTVYAAGLAAAIDTVAGLIGRAASAAELEPMTWNFYEFGRGVSGSQYLRAVTTMQQAGRAFAGFFEEIDVWLTPTLGALPYPVGMIDFSDPRASLADPRIAAFAHYNPVYNVSGLPAISLPLQVSAAGLPIGMLFGTRYGEEGLLLQLAGELEAAQPWRGRRPAV